MTFLNPLVLLGLAAASIPVLLHLLNLRKLKTIEFSSLTFIKELQKTKIRKLKLKQILLLILRTLIIIFIVVAFARPTIESSLPGLGTRARSSIVVLVDNSFSMDIADERGVRLKQAKDAVLSILNSLKEGDEVALVQMANTDDRRFFELSRNFSLLKEEVGKLPLSYTVAHLESGLRIASSILSTSHNINKEVYVVTDAQRNIITEEKRDSLKIFDKSVAVYVLPVGLESKAGERNLSIDSLHIITQIFEADKPVEVEARIRNSGREDVKGVIVSLLFNGERVAQRALDIPAGETRMVPIAAGTKSSGVVRAAVEVEGDALDADNRRSFGFIIPEKPKVALIGSPTDTRFLSLALKPEPGIEATADIIPLNVEQLSSSNLNDFDVLFLANIPLFTQSDVTRIQSFVHDGKGLLLFGGDKADIASYNQTILPALGFGQASLKEYSHETPGEFTGVDKIHPLFTGVFKGATDGRAAVESPKITRALVVNGGQEIIRLADGAFLSENKVGNGRVLYCAVPPSTQWSTFPLTGIFATIVNRAASYLSATEAAGSEVIVGEPVHIALPNKYASGGNFKIIDPNKNESFRQAVVLPGGTVLSMEAFHQPGVYVIQTADGHVVRTVAVNPPASESILSQLTESELREALVHYVPDKNQIGIVENIGNVAQAVSRVRVGTELWKLFVILALMCAIAEMFVAKNSVVEAPAA